MNAVRALMRRADSSLSVFALACALAGALSARAVTAQAPRTARQAAGASVSGVVRDSVAGAPLAGAWVQLAPTDGQTSAARTVITDSTGRFAFDDVPDGRYAIGFFHPMLDSLGVEPPLRTLVVRGARAVRADLAIPSGATLRAAICGVRSPRDSGVVVEGGVVVGVVRDARRGAPAADAVVSAEWLEMSFRLGAIDRRRPRVVVTTGANGWFALCNVPARGTLFVGASRGAEGTDLIEVQMPAEGFVRRELYLGASRTVVTGDTTRADSLAPPRRVPQGDGRLRGVVLTADGGRPLAGATVRLAEGPMARADERGEWTVSGAPTGTRVLEVRAVGYYPVRRAVDVVANAAPVRVALSTFKAVLDTVKIIASGLGPDRHYSGFDDRRRTGLGRYFTAADLEKRGVIETSDIFHNTPIVRREGDTLLMRSAFNLNAVGAGDANFSCKPSVFLDGMNLFQASASEIDMLVPARKVRAIEIYDEAFVPPQFQQGLSGCGSIVIWTK